MEVRIPLPSKKGAAFDDWTWVNINVDILEIPKSHLQPYAAVKHADYYDERWTAYFSYTDKIYQYVRDTNTISHLRMKPDQKDYALDLFACYMVKSNLLTPKIKHFICKYLFSQLFSHFPNLDRNTPRPKDLNAEFYAEHNDYINEFKQQAADNFVISDDKIFVRSEPVLRAQMGETNTYYDVMSEIDFERDIINYVDQSGVVDTKFHLSDRNIALVYDNQVMMERSSVVFEQPRLYRPFQYAKNNLISVIDYIYAHVGPHAFSLLPDEQLEVIAQLKDFSKPIESQLDLCLSTGALRTLVDAFHDIGTFNKNIFYKMIANYENAELAVYKKEEMQQIFEQDMKGFSRAIYA